MWARNLLFLSLLLASSPLSGQSFEPSAIYEVTGTELNRLEMDLKIANEKLETLQMRNEQLEKDSENKVKQLEKLEAQLKTVYQSWKASENEALKNNIIVGAIALAIGYTTAALATNR